MASISGSVTIAGDPDDWIACAFDADTHAYAGVSAVSGGTYEITGLTAGSAYVVACRTKTGGIWVANKSTYLDGDYVCPTNPVATPYVFKADSTPGDLEWNSVVLSMSFNGANGSTDFSSADARGHTITPSGGASLSTSQVKFGSASLALDGSGDYLTISDSNDWTWAASESFTIECWFYVTSTAANRTIFSIPDYGFYFYVHGTQKKIWLSYSGVWSLTHNTVVTENDWHHVAIVRNGTVFTVYLDGVASGTQTQSLAFNPTSLVIGRYPTQTTWDFAGYLDDFRITKGVARYTSGFSVPAAEFIQAIGVPTGSSEPTWPTTPGNTVVDGGVTWTNMGQLVQPLMQGPLIAA